MFKELTALHQHSLQSSSNFSPGGAPLPLPSNTSGSDSSGVNNPSNFSPSSTARLPTGAHEHLATASPADSASNPLSFITSNSYAAVGSDNSGGSSSQQGGNSTSNNVARGLRELNSLEDPARQEQFLLSSVGAYLPYSSGANC